MQERRCGTPAGAALHARPSSAAYPAPMSARCACSHIRCPPRGRCPSTPMQVPRAPSACRPILKRSAWRALFTTSVAAHRANASGASEAEPEGSAARMWPSAHAAASLRLIPSSMPRSSSTRYSNECLCVSVRGGLGFFADPERRRRLPAAAVWTKSRMPRGAQSSHRPPPARAPAERPRRRPHLQLRKLDCATPVGVVPAAGRESAAARARWRAQGAARARASKCPAGLPGDSPCQSTFCKAHATAQHALRACLNISA